MEKARPWQSVYRERTFKRMDIVSASEMICQRESAPPQDRERHPARTQLLGFATGSGNGTDCKTVTAREKGIREISAPESYSSAL